ncbi:MAG TPA: c-type cytochrome domain-containing protein [Cyclobacteriaceae bacterium]
MLFLGRFHPLLVHFPIVLLLTAFVFEVMSRSHHFRGLKFSVLPLMLLGSVAAVFSALTGYFISQEGGYDQSTLDRHQWSGIATAVVALAATAAKWRKSNQRGLVGTLFIILTVLVVATGHLGAGLTHGRDFLTEYAPWNRQRETAFALPVISNPDEAVLYADMIRPILEQRCYSCHSEKRQKGNLRLDSEEFIRKGGDSGPILNGREGELCRRLLLPAEHEDHMPPNEREQPSSAEIELIAAWVESGADFNAKVASLDNAPRIKSYWSILQTSADPSWLPDEDVDAADAKAIAALAEAGALVMPVAANSSFLTVDFLNVRSFGPVAEPLRKLRDQVVDLRAEGKTLPDSVMTAITLLRNLRKVSLANSSFNAERIDLSALPNLVYLNLTGTGVGEEALAGLPELRNLRKLYLYRTNVKEDAVAQLRANNPGLEVDMGGYDLPVLATDTLVYRR